jgi:hypothetical protein
VCPYHKQLHYNYTIYKYQVRKRQNKTKNISIFTVLNFVIMGNRPIREHKPLMAYANNYEQKVSTLSLITIVFNNAVKQGLWLFDPSIKRWFNPDEFMDLYKNYDNLDPKWIEKIEIRDPIEGLEAADTQIESILSRKAILTKRVIEYERAKKRKHPNL